ncbi:MAG: hypothetical protein QG657_4037 [Acidobacteriota bacterium]|nr:hypothetical protein [Acidobacteriota bacterium]
MFQWTLGVKNDPGELPALVEKIKKHDFNIFQTYYGQYGLDAQLSNSTSGFFTLKGDLMTSQYGLALILDNHVNRPGYIAGCLGKALANTVKKQRRKIKGFFYKNTK